MQLGINTSGVTPYTAKGAADRPLVRLVSNQELIEQAKADAERSAQQVQNQPVITHLAGHIRSSFNLAVRSRQTVTDRLLKCRRQRDGEYDSDVKLLIDKENGNDIFMRLTDTKCHHLEAWLQDIMLPEGERPFAIEPTPIPDIPPQMVIKAWRELLRDFQQNIMAQTGGVFDPSMIDQDELREAAGKLKEELLKQLKEFAKEDCKKIEDQVDDEFIEGKWRKALSEFIEDFATYPTAFMEGPIYRNRKVFEWIPVGASRLKKIQVVDKVVKEYRRIDPYNVYSSPGASTIQDGDLCIRDHYSRRDLQALIGVDGFSEEAINLVLDRYGTGGYKEHLHSDTEHHDLHDRPQEQTDQEGRLDTIKFYGSVPGHVLRLWGMSEQDISEPLKDYNIIAYTVADQVIGARLNPHPLGRRNIYSASFREKNGSIWGRALPEVMEDTQKMCNSIARSITKNLAFAAGPQTWFIVDRIPPGEKITDMFPFKIWQFTKSQTTGAHDLPIGFFQPRLIAGQLLKVYDYFFKQASEVSGVPAHIYGQESSSGAVKTASGLAMLRNDAARGLKKSSKNIDQGVIKPSVEEHWLSIVFYEPDKAIGDIKIVARASEYLLQQEQLQMRRGEFLEATNNPVDLQIMGIDGRSEVLKEAAKGLKMPIDKIIPSREDMMATQVQAEMQRMVMALSQALNIPPEQLIQILRQPQQGQGGGQPAVAPKEQDFAGNQVAGEGMRLFNG